MLESAYETFLHQANEGTLRLSRILLEEPIPRSVYTLVGAMWMRLQFIISRIFDPKNSSRMVAICCVLYSAIFIGVASTNLISTVAMKLHVVSLAILITVEQDDTVQVHDSLLAPTGDGASFLVRALPKGSLLGHEYPVGSREVQTILLDGVEYPVISRNATRHLYYWPKLTPDLVAMNTHKLELRYTLKGGLVLDGSERRFLIPIGEFGNRLSLASVNATLLLLDPSTTSDPTLGLLRSHEGQLVSISQSDQNLSNTVSVDVSNLSEHRGEFYLMGSWVRSAQHKGQQ